MPQAYHVTDSSMAYFSTSMLRDTLRTLILQHCWEITNQGAVNLAHSLPSLTFLSLSGCSKVISNIFVLVIRPVNVYFLGHGRGHRNYCRTIAWPENTRPLLVPSNQWCGLRVYCLWFSRIIANTYTWPVSFIYFLNFVDLIYSEKRF